MVKQPVGEADGCPPPPVPPAPTPPGPTTTTIPLTAPSRRYGYCPGFMKATLRAAPGAKRKLGNALRWATISCWRVPRLVQSTLPPARIATPLGLRTPSATVTDAPPRRRAGRKGSRRSDNDEQENQGP